MAKVSILTAAYNHFRFVRQSIESGLAQTYRDIEHVVVDDGSTDGTEDVARSFDNRIVYIRQENRGAHAALNRAIKASSGEHVALLDSDDIWLPHKLERQMNTFEQFPDAGFVYSLAYLIGPNGEPLRNGEPIGTAISDPQRAFEELVLGNCIPAGTVVARRTCIEKVGLFDESLKASSDWDLWLRIAAKWPVVCVAEPLAMFRIHEKSSWPSLERSGRAFEERILTLNKLSAEIAGREREFPGLKKRALSRAYLFGAMTSAAAGNPVSAVERFSQCAVLDPGFARESALDVKWQILVTSGKTAAAEFLESVEIAIEGRLRRPGRTDTSRVKWYSAPVLDPADVASGNYRNLTGVYSDGWVEEDVSFTLRVPPRASAAVVECMVPANPKRADWRLTALPIVDRTSPSAPTVLEPGLTKLVVEFPPRDAPGLVDVKLRFGPGFQIAGPDPREFRARLHSMLLVTDALRASEDVPQPLGELPELP